MAKLTKISKTDALNNKVVADRANAFDSYSNYMGWLPNPDPVLKKAGKTVAVYRELLTDPFVKGCYNSRKAATLSLEWDIDRGQAKSKAAKFMKSVFDNIDIHALLSNILDAPAFGMAVFEIVWQSVDGYIIPEEILLRPSEWFAFNNDNQLLFKSKANPMGEPVPYNKFIVVQHNSTYNNPYGEAILSECFWPATFKKGGLKFWVTFTEKFGMPWTIANVPVSWDDKKTDELVESLGLMVQDGVIVAPETVAVKLEFAGNAPVEIYKEMLQFCKDDISMAFLGHTKAGQSVPGELGNQNQSKEIRGDITLSDKRLCEANINKIIDMIYTLNFDSGAAPKFILFEETDVDKATVERDKIMFDMGVKFTPEYFKRAYYLNDTDFVVTDEPKPPNASVKVENKPNSDNPLIDTSKVADQGENGEGASFAGENPLPEGQVLIDDAAAVTLKKSRELIANLTKPIKDYINGKADFAQAMDGLADLYPKLNTDELYNKLVSIQFAADLVGRFEIRADRKVK